MFSTIAQLADAGELNLAFTDEPRRILLHGHCHQKALIGTGPARRALSLPPNYAVTELDTSCCGLDIFPLYDSVVTALACVSTVRPVSGFPVERWHGAIFPALQAELGGQSA